MEKEIPVNPYIVGNPIKSREMFFGREDDFAFVARKIREDRSNQIVVLCGERRSGKTSILFQILDGRLGEAFLPILIDMQMLAGIKGDADFYRAILKAGCAQLGLEGLTLEALESGPDGVERLFESFLARVQERMPGRTVLFLVDEYELIEAKIRDSSLSESAIHYLAGILESPYRVSFIFTGSTNLEDREAEVWKSLLGKSIYRKISYLSRADTARLITEPVRESVAYPPEVVEEICRLTGGQPFYTQVICQNMVDLLMEEKKNSPQAAELEKIVRDIVDNPLPQMIYSWNSLAEWNQLILASLASGLPGPGSWAGRQLVHRFLQRNRIPLPFKKERISVLLEEGYHAELLEKDDNEAYCFRMDLLRRWIRREHSIWKVAREAGIDFRTGRRRFALIAGIVAVAAGAAALGWFVVLPRYAPGLVHTAAPAAEAAGQAPAALSNVVFTANRGPWRLNIDGGASLTSEGTRDQKSITVQALAPGRHTIVATPRDGAAVQRVIELTRDGQAVSIIFAAVALAPAAPPKGQASASAEAPGTGETAAGTQAAEAADGDLVITSRPADALVTLDGEPTGKLTPYMEKIPAGAHEISVSHEGYRTATVTVTVERGRQARQDVTLEDAWAEITFDVRPTAQVFLDDAHILDTPYAKPYRVRAGTHRITIRNEALKVDETITVTVGDGEALPVKRVLK